MERFLLMHRLNKNAYANVTKFIGDLLSIAFSAGLAFLLSGLLFNLKYDLQYTWMFIAFAPIYFIIMHTQGMYQKTTFFYPDRVIRNVCVSCIFSFIFIWILEPFVISMPSQDRLLGVFMMTVSIILVAQNYLYIASLRNRKGFYASQGIIIGNRDIIMEYLHFINKTSFRTNIIGYILTEGGKSIPASKNLGKLEKLEEILNQYIVDEVIFALPKDRTGGIKRYVELCEQRGVTVKIVLDLFDLRIAKSYVHSVGTLPVLTYHTVCLNETQLLLKRVMDIVGALFGILITGLLSIFIIPAIELDSRGPVLFAQPRVGQNGRVFKLLKFRSMCVNADSMKRDFMAQNEVKGGFMFKIKNDPRVTRVGAFLRKSSLDQLPQFINVLKGDMSLVGTRPPTLDEVEKYRNSHYRRISIKPGITGLWQISGRSEINDFDDVVKLDTHYIDNWSMWLDIKIIFKTITAIFNKKGAY